LYNEHFLERNKRETKKTRKSIRRYTAKVIEAFVESQATLRAQVGFYLAFSFIISQKGWKNTEIIAEKIIGGQMHFFKFNVYGWHGIPVLLFSSITSLLSITFAQCNLYKTTHEFDMGILGQILYLFGSLGVVFSKLSAQVMFVMALNSWTLSQDLSPGLEVALLIMPHLLINVLHDSKEIFINYKMATPHETSGKGGYFLTLKFLTTTGRRYPEDRWRWNEIDMQKPPERPKLWKNYCDKIFKQTRYYIKYAYWYFNAKLIRNENRSWIIFNFVPLFHHTRVYKHPDKYGFEKKVASRKKFQQRFVMGLGFNFLFTCFEIVTAFFTLEYVFHDIDLTSRLHLYHATYFWLSVIPIYLISLMFIWLFYNHGHVWKKEKISIGYKFDSEEKDKLRPLWLHQFVGEWVSHTIRENQSTERKGDKWRNTGILVLILLNVLILVTLFALIILGGYQIHY